MSKTSGLQSSNTSFADCFDSAMHEVENNGFLLRKEIIKRCKRQQSEEKAVQFDAYVSNKPRSDSASQFLAVV
jgi:hypothetical protein